MMESLDVMICAKLELPPCYRQPRWGWNASVSRTQIPNYNVWNKGRCSGISNGGMQVINPICTVGDTLGF